MTCGTLSFLDQNRVGQLKAVNPRTCSLFKISRSFAVARLLNFLEKAFASTRMCIKTCLPNEVHLLLHGVLNRASSGTPALPLPKIYQESVGNEWSWLEPCVQSNNWRILNVPTYYTKRHPQFHWTQILVQGTCLAFASYTFLLRNMHCIKPPCSSPTTSTTLYRKKRSIASNNVNIRSSAA